MDATGTVKRILEAKNFGFIATETRGDVFFHAKDVSPALPFDETLLGRRVRLEIEQTPKGMAASFVRAAD